MGTTFDIDAARRGQRRRTTERQADLAKRFAQAQADFDTITSMIVCKYRPVRLHQWGSLLDRSRFTEVSDIDIGIEGIADPAVFFQLLSDVEQLSDFPVHIVQMDRIEPEFREIIEQRGRIVYEQQD